MTPTIDNVLSIYRQANASEIAIGKAWYESAHCLANTLSPGSTARGAGVIAALSPMTPWHRNLILAQRAFADGIATGSLPTNCAKANAIMAGANPLDILGGNKVRNFYLNILDPLGNGVTIDRHAHDIAMGEPYGSRSRPLLERKGGYELFVDLYRTAAYATGLVPSQVQAITWTTWRNARGIVQ